MEQQKTSNQTLPSFFHPLLWSYDTARIDVQRDQKTIIVQALNYGDLIHWRWILNTYGSAQIQQVLGMLPESELRPRVRKLVMLVFGINTFGHARRRID